MGFDVRTEFGNIDPEAKRALVAMQHAIKGHLDEVERRARRPKRAVTELVEEGAVLARPGQVVRVQPSDTDISVILPPSDSGNGGEDIIVSFEGDGTAAGKVLVTSASSSCANPATTTLNSPGSYRFTSTGAPSEGDLAQDAAWSGPAPVALEDLPEIAPQRLLGNNTGATASPTELSASQVLDWVGSTRGSVLERGAAGWTAITPGAIELPIVSKGAGADPVYQQLATAGIADDAVTNAKLANMATPKLKGRTSAGTGDPEDLTPANSTSNTWNVATGGSISVERAALTGDVTASANANATTIANNAVTNAKAADMASPRLKGRTTAATGDPEDLTLVNSTSVTWNTGTGGSISVERAALTGDVTASANSNACTVAYHLKENQAVTWAAQQDDFARSSSAINVLQVTLTGDQTLTGITGGSSGDLLVIQNVDATDKLTLASLSASSSAANRIRPPNGADVILGLRENALLQYSTDGANGWRVLAAPQAGRLIAYTEYTSGSGTHTYNAQTTFAIRDLTGGGGAGGGTVGGSGASAGGGGQAGATRRTAGSVTPGSAVSYSVGAGGSGSSGAAGGSGSPTTMDASTSAIGGDGGRAGTNATINNIALGGGDNATGSQGAPGDAGFAVVEGGTDIAFPGKGGDGPDGGGGWANPIASTATRTGSVGRLPGAGGSGACNVGTAGNQTGGGGVAGRIRIWEFS